MALLAVNASLGSDVATKAQVAAGTHQWASIGRATWGSTDREARNATEAAAAGDEVQAAAGTYVAASATHDRFASWYYTENSGSIGSPIIFKAMGEVVLQTAPAYTGTLTGVGAASFSDNTQGWVLNQLDPGYSVRITGGPAAGQVKFVSNNGVAAETCDLFVGWDVLPNVGDPYELRPVGPIFGAYINRDYLTWAVDDLATCKWTIDSAVCPAASDTGHVVAFSANDITIEGFEIAGHDPAGWGDNYSPIRVEDCENVDIRNNTVHGARNQYLVGGPVDSHNGAAIMSYGCNGGIWENNTLYDSGVGIHIKGESTVANQNLTLRYNLIYASANGIRVDFHTGPGTTFIYQNVLLNDDHATAGSGNGINIASSPNNLLIYNNTIYGWAGGGIAYNVTTGTKTNVVIRDNLIANVGQGINAGEISTVDTWNYDHIYVSGPLAVRFGSFNGVNYATRALFSAAVGQEINGGDSDPQFINPGTNIPEDYKLAGTSPALTSSSTGGPVGAYILGTEVIGANTAGAEGGGGDGGGSPPPAVGWTQEVALVSGTGWLSEGLL